MPVRHQGALWDTVGWARSRLRLTEVEKGLATQTEVSHFYEESDFSRSFRSGQRRIGDGPDWSSKVDVLGAHNNSGRGCAGCHAPHSGSFGSGHGWSGGCWQLRLVGTRRQPAVRPDHCLWRQRQVRRSSAQHHYRRLAGSWRHSALPQLPRWQPTPKAQHDDGHRTSSRSACCLPTAYGDQPIPTLLGNDGTTARELQQ